MIRTREPHCRLTIYRTAPKYEDILNQGTAQHLSEPLLKRVTAILTACDIQYRRESRDEFPLGHTTRYNDAPVDIATFELLGLWVDRRITDEWLSERGCRAIRDSRRRDVRRRGTDS